MVDVFNTIPNMGMTGECCPNDAHHKVQKEERYEDETLSDLDVVTMDAEQVAAPSDE